jgi:hypothetical protein
MSDEIEEGLVDTGVVGEFGVECGGHRSTLPDRHGVGALGGKDFDAFSDVRNFGSTDEDHFQRRLGEPVVEVAKKFPFADGAVELPSISIATDADIEGAETGLRRILHFFGQKDCASARTESGLKPDEMFKLFESGLAEKLEEGAGFSSRNHEPVDGLELFGLPDQHDFSAQLLEPAAVGVKIALQSKDSDLQSQSLSPRTRQSNPQELLHFNGCAGATCTLQAARGRWLHIFWRNKEVSHGEYKATGGGEAKCQESSNSGKEEKDNRTFAEENTDRIGQAGGESRRAETSGEGRLGSHPVATGQQGVGNLKLADGILLDRPGHRHHQSDGDSEGHFDESVSGDNPRRATVRDQKNDAERDGGEAVGGADSQDRTEDAAEKYAGTVHDPILTGITGDKCGDNRAESGPREALPSESQRIDRGEQNHDGGNRRPIELRQLEAACQQQSRDGRNRGPGGGDESVAGEPQAGCPSRHIVVIVSCAKQRLRYRTRARVRRTSA